MSIKHAQRQARYVERKEALGQKRIMFWLTPEEKEYVSRIIEIRRKGFTGLNLSTNDKTKSTNEKININNIVNKDNKENKEDKEDKEDKEKKSLIDQIKSGTFLDLPVHESRRYYHDLLTDPDRHWDKPLPNAYLVLEDHHQSVQKWRAVKLQGLGALPVVWSIVYVLKRYAYGKAGLSKPKRRTFDLSVISFEEIVQLIVGNACMKADDRLKQTPFGFLTHQISVTPLKVYKENLDEISNGSLLVVIDRHGKLKKTNAFCDNQETVTSWNLIQPIMDNKDKQEGWNPYFQSLVSMFER